MGRRSDINTTAMVKSETGSRDVDLGSGTVHLRKGSEIALLAGPPDLNEGSTTPKEAKQHRKKGHHFEEIIFVPRPSILDDEQIQGSRFFGFFNLFWIFLVFSAVRVVAHNYEERGYLLGVRVPKLLRQDLIHVALTDLFLTCSTFFAVLLEKACVNHIRWKHTGVVIETIFECIFLATGVFYPKARRFPWIGQVYILLHSLVLLMKAHSYSFYCGYLSDLLRERRKLQRRIEGIIKENKPSAEQVVEDLELQVKSIDRQLISKGQQRKRYPDIITFSNFFEFLMFPTLIYTIEYPRTKSIRWWYVGKKVAATFGIFFLMIMLAENVFYPEITYVLSLRDLPVIEKLKRYPMIFLDLSVPFGVVYLFVFYIIWDAILNAVAELTRFADRQFYAEWWNSVSWDQFARDWNVPVHLFLLRHVYRSSISTFHIPRSVATIVTFLLSSFIHELVMYCIFDRLRCYLLILQMFQIPLIAVSRSSILRSRPILGNIIFWIGILTGPSMMCSLYLLF